MHEDDHLEMEYEDRFYVEDDYDDEYFDEEEIEAAKGRHPSTFDTDEDEAIHKMEDAYEKYLDRMKEHGP